MTDPNALDAWTAADLIAVVVLTSTALVEARLDQIEAYESDIHA